MNRDTDRTPPDERQNRAGDDPYERDSDHEYSSLEADAADDDAGAVQQAQRFDAIDATEFPDTADEDVESMAPGRTETRQRLDAINQRLDDSVDRDPESISMNEARRTRARTPDELDPQDELQQPLDRMMDRTPMTTDDLDTEAVMDTMDDVGDREEAP